jgi:hypothetical protein
VSWIVSFRCCQQGQAGWPRDAVPLLYAARSGWESGTDQRSRPFAPHPWMVVWPVPGLLTVPAHPALTWGRFRGLAALGSFPIHPLSTHKPSAASQPSTRAPKTAAALLGWLLFRIISSCPLTPAQMGSLLVGTLSWR